MGKIKTLKPEEDVFGQMMWAYYNGREICEIVERDDGYFSAHKTPYAHAQGFIMPFVEVRVMLKVKDVMVTNVVTVDVGVSVRKAVERMNAQEIGCLVVLEKGHYAGILTERDVLTRVVAKARNPEKVFVGQVMSKPLTVVDPETSLEEAIKLMLEKRVKKLPVIKTKKLVGLITMTDIASTHPGMVKFIRDLSAKYDVPKRIKKVIDYYVV